MDLLAAKPRVRGGGGGGRGSRDGCRIGVYGCFDDKSLCCLPKHAFICEHLFYVQIRLSFCCVIFPLMNSCSFGAKRCAFSERYNRYPFRRSADRIKKKLGLRTCAGLLQRKSKNTFAVRL